MEAYMKELGVAMDIKSLGVSEDILDDISKSIFVLDGGYKVLTNEEIIWILKDSMKQGV